MKKSAWKILIALSLVVMVLGSSVPAEARTLAGFSYFGKHYYKVVHTYTSRSSWASVKQSAAADYILLVNKKRYEGHLATITSARENAFVQSLIQDNHAPAWIGASQAMSAASTGDGWSWVTGEAWSYTNWASGQPDDGAGAEICLIMNADGAWSDVLPGYTGAVTFVVECELVR
jgi:Lectin C-type domain